MIRFYSGVAEHIRGHIADAVEDKLPHHEEVRRMMSAVIHAEVYTATYAVTNNAVLEVLVEVHRQWHLQPQMRWARWQENHSWPEF